MLVALPGAFALPLIDVPLPTEGDVALAFVAFDVERTTSGQLG